VAIAAIKGERTIAQIAEQFDVHPNQVTTWKAQLEGGAPDVFDHGTGIAQEPPVDVKALHAKIGEQTLKTLMRRRGSKPCTASPGRRSRSPAASSRCC
jgi:transposase